MGHRDASSQEAFFNCLYEERFSKMKRYALILLSNPELAEEVEQDAFLELYLHIDEVMAHEKLEFWLQKAVKYKSLHQLRERARDLKQYVSLDSDAIPPISAPDEFEKIEEDPDSLEKLNRKISEALPAKDLHIFKRVALDGVPYKKISEESGLTIGVCQKRVQRTRQKLKKRLLEQRD